MTHYLKILIVLLLSNYLSSNLTFAQSKGINWLTFNQLDDSLKLKPKKVFINFYADWCTICKEMDLSTYKNSEVISILNLQYYAVRMNVESRDTILFGNQVFVNKRIKKINPIHEIPLLMASRKDKPFSLPAIVLLNDEFIAEARYFQYLDSGALLKILGQ